MPEFVFNIAKGAFVEKIRDGASNVGVLLLSAAEADDDLMDHADLAALLGAVGNTEVADPSYGRKVNITGTVTVDNSNNRTDADAPDQEFPLLEGPDVAALIFFYEESASDAGRIPLTNHPAPVTTDGTNVQFILNGAGFGRAA